jgi:hypothetical protein
MSNRRFASWPEFNGRRVVLDDDNRLNGGVPTNVPEDMIFEIGDDMQSIAFVRIIVSGTLIVDGTLVMY